MNSMIFLKEYQVISQKLSQKTKEKLKIIMDGMLPQEQLEVNILHQTQFKSTLISLILYQNDCKELKGLQGLLS